MTRDLWKSDFRATLVVSQVAGEELTTIECFVSEAGVPGLKPAGMRPT